MICPSAFLMGFRINMLGLDGNMPRAVTPRGHFCLKTNVRAVALLLPNLAIFLCSHSCPELLLRFKKIPSYVTISQSFCTAQGSIQAEDQEFLKE